MYIVYICKSKLWFMIKCFFCCQGYVLVPLEESGPEYGHVVMQFFKSMIDHSVEVTGVYRVQNPIQWKYYSV